MLQQRWLVVTSAIVACILQAHCADKYTDENRPYEFGFNIEGEQHRHEKKDENGLIMGEFGFITADGVYHVTVYATDENGNFKILSMKNIRTKPFPTAPERKGHSIPFPPSQNPPPAQGPSPQKPLNPIPGPVQAAPAKSCSHCSLPTTTTQKPLLTDIAFVSKDQGSQYDGSLSTHEQNPQGAQNNQDPPHNYPGQNINGGSVHQVPQGQNYPSQPVYSSAEGNSQIDPSVPSVSVGSEQGQNNPDPSNYPQLGPNPPPITGGSQPGKNYPFPGGVSQFDDPNTGLNYPQQNLGGVQENYNVISSPGQTLQAPLSNSGERSPKQFTDYPQQPVVGPVSQNNPQGNLGDNGPQDNINARPNKPTLISAQMQIVDKNTDINHKNPGEKDGLPNGLTKDDMVRLLYTFNYTVGFHGHFEEGYTNGAKQGYYFVTGRNGVRTRVDYVADEKGFRPKITEEVLDLLSDEVPKPETEKDEKYGLKGYEFKWLYYPVESRKR